MKVYNNIKSLHQALTPILEQNKSLGFVPTMGALHQGHLSLVKKALSENDCVVISVFVNPTQFNNASDLDNYPRTLNDDIELLETLKGDMMLFAPEASHLYNEEIRSKKYHFSGLEFEMEGKHRKSHFDGVGTVLNLLFRIVKPYKAYFGEKDFQQLQIVKKLVEIEKLPIIIVGCPILREENGLAMSSRNKRLTKSQLVESALIYKTLKEVKQKFTGTSIPKLNEFVLKVFKENPTLRLEYFEIANVKTLKTAKRKHKKNSYRAFIAVFVGNIRLIDNIELN